MQDPPLLPMYLILETQRRREDVEGNEKGIYSLLWTLEAGPG